MALGYQRNGGELVNEEAALLAVLVFQLLVRYACMCEGKRSVDSESSFLICNFQPAYASGYADEIVLEIGAGGVDLPRESLSLSTDVAFPYALKGATLMVVGIVECHSRFVRVHVSSRSWTRANF